MLLDLAHDPLFITQCSITMNGSSVDSTKVVVIVYSTESISLSETVPVIIFVYTSPHIC